MKIIVESNLCLELGHQRQKGDGIISKKNGWLETWTTPLLLFSTILGIVLIIVSAFGSERVWFTVLRDIGIALLITGGLGLTVNKLLSQQFAKDAFNASMGYLLPPELKPELEWIYKQDIIAEKHKETVEIIPFSDDLVIMKVKLNRTFKNISHHRVPFTPMVDIDEWFHKECRSEIVEFGWTGKNVDYEETHTERNLHAEAKKSQKIWLKHNDTIDMWCTYKECKHIRDIHTDTFLSATCNPFIEVRPPKGFQMDVTFATHKEEKKRSQGTNRYELEGILLPGQEINTSWWRPEDSEEWKREIDKKHPTEKSD